MVQLAPPAGIAICRCPYVTECRRNNITKCEFEFICRARPAPGHAVAAYGRKSEATAQSRSSVTGAELVRIMIMRVLQRTALAVAFACLCLPATAGEVTFTPNGAILDVPVPISDQPLFKPIREARNPA